jgi:single-strand DNA-binding protein
MNTVSLTGNLATDVDLREFGEGKKVASFVLAVDRATKDGDADFIRISAWERQAELCVEYLTKGRLIGVEGRLRSSSWEDDEGKRRSSIEVSARRIDFLGGRTDREPAAETPFEAAVA